MGDTILVTGGTGTLGRAVVRRARDAGLDVRIASRRPKPARQPGGAPGWSTVDYRTGAGLAAALADVATIVHCATGMTTEARIARAVTEAARRAGTPHLVYVSIVGVDRIPFGYYRGKFEAERIIAESGLPHTIQRATQFHNLVVTIAAALAKSPILPVPAGIRVQPIDVGEVADRLVAHAQAGPAGPAEDIGGPQVREFPDLAAAYLKSVGQHRRMLPIRLPGKAFRAFRAGGNLTPEHAVGRVTFEEFLAANQDVTNR